MVGGRDPSHFFRLFRALVREGYWKDLCSASKAVLPVILSFVGKGGRCYPSQDTIAKLAGCTPKTVRVGIDGLKGLSGFEVLTNSVPTARGQFVRQYHWDSPPTRAKNVILIHNALFDDDTWSLLSSNAKALYICLRCFAFGDCDGLQSEEALRARTYGILDDPDLKLLAKFAGIAHSKKEPVQKALKELHEAGLIERNSANKSQIIVRYWARKK